MNPMRSMRSMTLLAVLALAALLLASCRGGGSGPAAAGQYHCPMHPTIVSDHPGDCPICGMKLVPIEPGKAAAKGGGHAEEAAQYHCPMHPTIVSDHPGDCPICGMRLVPIEPAKGAAVRTGETTAPAEHAEIALPPDDLRRAGVQSAPAVRGTLSQTIRTVGFVVADETRVKHVHTKIAGWVEELFVNFTGQVVERGVPILSLYSPELLATQEEFLNARDSAARFGRSALPEVRRGGEDLLAAARRRLELFDVPAGLIEHLEKTGKPQRTVTLLAPVGGIVTGKEVLEGMRVEPGTELFTVTDLSRIWVEAEVYEYEAPRVRTGQKARFGSPYDPSLSLTGTVSYVYPYLNPQTRTLKVRFDFPNPGLELKPAMYLDVDLDVGSRDALLVAADAVMDTGTRRLVFVDLGEGRFEPRQVETGLRGDGRVEILSGLAEGERIATHANFLLDSESRIRAAIEGTSR